MNVLSSVFAPDVNFVSARAVYPTMDGGTIASASGAMSAQTTTVVPDPTTGSASPTVASAGALSMSGRSVFWWLGFVVLLAVMVAVARKAGGAEDFRSIRPTAYNFLTITLTSIVGIVGMKILAAKYRIPGASDVILSV